jgi:hypothetical protein
MVAWPFYIDDPLVDRTAHRLELHPDEDLSAARGYRIVFGSCSCGDFVTPSWEDSGVFEAYDNHMRDIQADAHARAENQ